MTPAMAFYIRTRCVGQCSRRLAELRMKPIIQPRLQPRLQLPLANSDRRLRIARERVTITRASHRPCLGSWWSAWRSVNRLCPPTFRNSRSDWASPTEFARRLRAVVAPPRRWRRSPPSAQASPFEGGREGLESPPHLGDVDLVDCHDLRAFREARVEETQLTIESLVVAQRRAAVAGRGVEQVDQHARPFQMAQEAV